MKLVPPIVINDTNMVSNAPDDDYPVWGTDYAVSEYPEPVPYRMSDLFMNWRTKDLWIVGGNRLFKQPGASGAFTEILLSANPLQAVTVNPYTGRVYTIHRENPAPATYEAVITKIDPATHESSELGRFTIAADPGNLGITCDGFTGDLFAIGGAAVVKYTYATDTLATHATLAYTYSRSIAIDPITKNLYVVVSTPTSDVLMQTASSGAFAVPAGGWTNPRKVAIDELTQDVYVTDTSPANVYKRTAGTGAFAVFPDMGFSAISACAALGDILFSDYSTAKLWAYSPKLFSAEDYAVYGGRVYYALADSYQVTPGTDSTKWFLHSDLNRLRMFDSQLMTKTEVSGMNLIVSFTSNEIDTIGLFNVVGASATVIVTNGGGVVESSTQTVSTRNVIFENLPDDINAVYQVVITPLNGVASCGNMVAGMSNAIGTLMRDVELSLVSYSKTTIDDFGRPSFTVRGRAKKLECAMRVEKTDSNRVYELFNQNDAKLCMWVGPSGYPHLTVFGWYQRFELQLGAADTAKYNLEIQGDVDTSATETSPALVTPGALEIVEAYLSAEGDGVFLMFNRAAYVGAGGSGGVVVTIGEIDYPLTYVSGDGTNAFLFEFSGAFVYDGTAVVDYTQPGNGLEDGDGEDLVVSTPVPLDLLYGGVHPTVVSITIAENGTTVTIVFDLPVSIGAGGSGGFTLNGATLTYVSGLPGNTAVFSVAKILQGVTVVATYVQPGGGIEQAVSGLDLLSFSGVNAGSNSGTAPASIVSATINAAGNQLTVVFSEAMSQGAGYQNTDINLDGSIGGTDIGLTYVSGSGSDTWVFSIAKIIRAGETVDLDFIGRSDGIEDASGNDLGAIGSMAVTNGSEESYSDIVFWEGFEGGLTGLDYLSTENDYPPNHTGVIGSTSYVTMNTAVKRVGAKSIKMDEHGNADAGNAKITFILDTPVQEARGRIGMWVRMFANEQYLEIFKLWNSAAEATCYLSADTGSYTDGTTVGSYRSISSTVSDGIGKVGSLSPSYFNAWGFLEIAWDHDGFGSKIMWNGQPTSITSQTPAYSWSRSYDRLTVGATTATSVGSQLYFDNVMISTDPNRDLYALALLEACPRV